MRIKLKPKEYEEQILFLSELYLNRLRFVYMIKCWNGENEPFYYIGQTKNIFRRLEQHFNNYQTSLKGYINKELVYLEIYENTTDTIKRERELKNLPLKDKLMLIDSVDKKLLNKIQMAIENKREINENITKYYFYEKNKQSIVAIPVSIAKGLNWEHLDKIEVIIEVMNGNKGIFLFKKED